MSRNSRRFGRVMAPEVRSSLGDNYVDEAVKGLDRTCGATVATMTNYDRTREQTLPMIFLDADLHKAREANHLVDASTDIISYDVGHDVKLFVNYRDGNCPAIQETALYLQPARMGPLINHIVAVRAIHDKFEQVKGMMRWLNRNATPGAIRYYWPTVLQLCPRSPNMVELQHVPARYTNPPNIGDWMQALKDTAATVAGSQMLPTAAHPKPRGTMWLTFAAKKVDIDVGNFQHYTTDTMIYNL